MKLYDVDVGAKYRKTMAIFSNYMVQSALTSLLQVLEHVITKNKEHEFSKDAIKMSHGNVII